MVIGSAAILKGPFTDCVSARHRARHEVVDVHALKDMWPHPGRTADAGSSSSPAVALYLLLGLGEALGRLWCPTKPYDTDHRMMLFEVAHDPLRADDLRHSGDGVDSKIGQPSSTTPPSGA